MNKQRNKANKLIKHIVKAILEEVEEEISVGKGKNYGHENGLREGKN